MSVVMRVYIMSEPIATARSSSALQLPVDMHVAHDPSRGPIKTPSPKRSPRSTTRTDGKETKRTRVVRPTRSAASKSFYVAALENRHVFSEKSC